MLDEADRMLDMGFSDDIMQIVKHLPVERQTIMFSATMPKKIQDLARTILRDPVEVKLAVSRPADKIVQSAYVCYEAQKITLVKKLFAAQPPQRVIIFASSKQKVKDMAIVLKRAGFNVGAMHSDLDQHERDEVMYQFKAQQINILVATDIVARGIDIDDIQLVINFDVPHDAEDYVHRIGRTARANNDGEAITLVSEKDRQKFVSIERFLKINIEKRSLPEGMEAPSTSGKSDERPRDKKGRDRHKKNSARRKNKEKRQEELPQNAEMNEVAMQGTGNVQQVDTAQEQPKEKKRKRPSRWRHNRKKRPSQDGGNDTEQSSTSVGAGNPATES